MPAALPQDLPDSLIDQAIRWAVVLGSGTTTTAERADFDRWLEADHAHLNAWRRVQSIEQELAAAPAGLGANALRRTERARRDKRRLLSSLGGLAGLLLACLLLLLHPLWQMQQADQVTARHEQRQLTLPGGALVYLNGATALDIAREDGVLMLHLHRGEILVDSSAAALADKPRVLTTDGRFTPLGTRFVVVKQDAASELAVIEGQVRAEARGGAVAEARAGERWRVTPMGIVSLPGNGLAPAAWINGVIEADDAPLGDVLQRLGQRQSGWLHYDDDVAQLRVTGVFRLDDPASALKALEHSLPVKVQRLLPWWSRVALDDSRR
ncbi:MAG TPA: DUF4880 domain-containing protein [Hyphomicrobiales bacterium]|nr:DUF4880 domain-containing protein [Hyphomicrobiales bacterium]